jgi:two-component system chemotaxis response regulator CheY
VARILVVDDARFIRATLANLFARGGHEVVAEAANGWEAVELYRQHQPDVMTLDLTMPQMDGIETLREIMAADPGARVIVVSAVNSRDKVIQALQLGARDFVLKPVKADRMLEALSRVETGGKRGTEDLDVEPVEAPVATAATTSTATVDSEPPVSAGAAPAFTGTAATPAPPTPSSGGDDVEVAPEAGPAKPKILPWRMRQQPATTAGDDVE